jgi:hypothetical protein
MARLGINYGYLFNALTIQHRADVAICDFSGRIALAGIWPSGHRSTSFLTHTPSLQMGVRVLFVHKVPVSLLRRDRVKMRK